MWSEEYQHLVTRNIGLLTTEQQDTLKNSCVAVCGLGGLGSPVAEILARSGIESFKLLDHGTFEPSNANRQIYCFTDTVGLKKTDVTEQYLKKINPAIKTEKFLQVTEENVADVLRGVQVVALTVDAILPILLLSRQAREFNIPLVEGWAMAFGNVRVFNEDTPSLEEVYQFPTIGRPLASITPEEQKTLLLQSIYSLQNIEGLSDHYPDAAIRRLLEKGEGTTFAPMVWLTCVMMAFEVIKVLLNLGTLALAPDFAVYDGFQHTLRRG